jgi:hypothetical protein
MVMPVVVTVMVVTVLMLVVMRHPLLMRQEGAVTQLQSRQVSLCPDLIRA